MKNDPRRRIVVKLDLGADSWEEVQATFRQLETEVAMKGRLSESAVSGGYGSGYILTSNEDETIDHDSWAKANDAYCARLKEQRP